MKPEELIHRYLNGEATKAEVAELDRLLASDRGLRRKLVFEAGVDTSLREIALERVSVPGHIAPKQALRVFRPLVWISFAAAAALMIGFAMFWGNAMPGNAMQNSVAVVQRTSDQDVDGGTRTFRVGQVLYPGALELIKGLVQLDLYSGVSLVVEGPASLEIISPDAVRMHSGKVRANVPPPARGFRLLTGKFDLVDLGTEFGVSVGKDGTAELHVIEGEVRVNAEGSTDNAGELLTTGKAVALNRDGSHSAITADEGKFAGTSALRERSEKRFSTWQQMMRTLADDSDTVALYDFQMGLDNRLPNLAKHGPADTQGAVVGCSTGQGRWAEKMSLDFRNSSQRVRVMIPGRFDHLTLATWVKVDSVQQFAQSFIQSESEQTHSLFWFLRHRKPAQGLVPNFADTLTNASGVGDRHPYQSDALALPFDLEGTWMHFAVTVNNSTREVVHYANGREINRQPITSPRPLAIGRADIGNWPSRDWATGTKWEVRNLVGNMDEFLISRRAFSSDEIHQLFISGRP